MAISLVAAGTLFATSVAGNVINPSLPSGWAANDILIGQVFTRSSGTGDAFTSAAGWSSLGAQSAEAAANPRHSAYFWKRATSTDVNPTFGYTSGTGGIGSSLGSYAVLTAWRGVTTAANPFDVVGVISTVATSGADNAITSPSITCTTGGLTVIKFYATADDNDLSSFSSPQIVAYGDGSYESVVGLDASFGCGYFVQASSGATGTHTCDESTLGFDVAQSFAVALIPSTVGAPTVIPRMTLVGVGP